MNDDTTGEVLTDMNCLLFPFFFFLSNLDNCFQHILYSLLSTIYRMNAICDRILNTNKLKRKEKSFAAHPRKASRSFQKHSIPLAVGMSVCGNLPPWWLAGFNSSEIVTPRNRHDKGCDMGDLKAYGIG